MRPQTVPRWLASVRPPAAAAARCRPSPKPMRVVGVDPSCHLAGWACIQPAGGGRERLLGHGVIPVRSAADIERAMDAFQDVYDVNVLGVEGSYIGANPQSGLALAEEGGRWRHAAERRGIRVVFVLASAWQASVLRVSPRAARAERKREAQAWALRTFAAELAEHAADAAGLAVSLLRGPEGPATLPLFGPRPGREAS